MEDNEVFEAENTDLPMSNILERGRYQVEVVGIEKYISQNGNKCNKVTLKTADGFTLFDNFVPESKMAWKWNQFLFAIGIRQKGRFQITKERILESKCLADVVVKTRKLEDGSEIKENKISSYCPIEQEVAPLKDVPAEELTRKEEKELKKQEMEDDDL